MKKVYHISDYANDFEVTMETTEEEIIKFSLFLEEIFGSHEIHYEEIAVNSTSLYGAYAHYLKADGFSECEEEIKMLKTIDKFINM